MFEVQYPDWNKAKQADADVHSIFFLTIESITQLLQVQKCNDMKEYSQIC